MIVVADNLRITLPAIARAVDNLDPAPIRQLVHACVDAGAMAIDVNSGPLSRRPEATMTFLIDAVRSACALPLVIDTTNPAAMAAALAASHPQTVINGVSLVPERLRRILPLARQYDADLIAYLLRPDGQVPGDAAGRLETAVTLFGELQSAGIAAQRIIIDPVVAPLTWPDGHRQNMAVLDTIRLLPDLLGFPVRTIAGLSNLTTGAPDPRMRRRYQSAFLPMLAAAGLEMILMSVLEPAVMEVASACRNLTAAGIFAWQAGRRASVGRDGHRDGCPQECWRKTEDRRQKTD